MSKDQPFIYRLKIAFFGLVSAFKEERNFRIQVFVAGIVVALIMVFRLTPIEVSLLILTMLVVLSLELVNSQIEKFLDILHPDHHPRVKIIKDFSAAAVLLSALGSVVIGVLIFWPYFVER